MPLPVNTFTNRLERRCTLGDQIRVVHDFSNDVESLLAALRRHRHRISGDLTAGTAEGLAPQETMCALASRTGGKAYTNRNDLGKAMRAAFADAEVTYTLECSVKVNRPGVDVRHRAGYFAFGDAAETHEERERRSEKPR